MGGINAESFISTESQEQGGGEEIETTEEVTTKGDVETRIITTIKRYVEPSGAY